MHGSAGCFGFQNGSEMGFIYFERIVLPFGVWEG
jgi:hypothetical protein